MSAITYGVTGSIFGVPAWTGYIVQTANLTYKPNVNETILNEQGQKVTRYYDDVETNLSLEAIVTSHSLSVSSSAQLVTSVINYNGTDYIVESVKDAYKNKGFMVGTFDCVTSANITI